MFTSYPPMKAAPHFYLGLILFAVGALVGVGVFFATLVIAKDERTYEGSVPLVTFGALTAAIIAVFTIASGAIILIPTFLWSVGIIEQHRSPDVQGGVVGHGSFVAADQRVGARRALVRHCGTDGRRAAAVGEGQPHGLPALHPVPAARLGAPSAGRARPQLGMEDLQHQLRDVPGGARQHDPRPDGARRDRGRAAAQRLHQGRVRVAAQGAVGQSRPSPACSCRW